MHHSAVTTGTVRRLAAYAMCALVALAGMPLPASAGIIGTEAVLTAESRASSLERIDRALDSAAVRDRMQQLGVDAAHVETRLAALTDAELADIATRLDSAPAGGDVIEVIGVVFLVLLILELVGVIDIFKSIGKVRTVD
jgi:hypothetical protein